MKSLYQTIVMMTTGEDCADLSGCSDLFSHVVMLDKDSGQMTEVVLCCRWGHISS